MTRSHSAERDLYLSEHLIRLGSLSYEMECKRYESLVSASGRLLTCCSIMLVVLLSFLPFAYDANLAPSCFLACSYVWVTFLVIASFVFGLIAQYRFKYCEIASPKDLADLIVKEQKLYETRITAAKHYCSVLQDPYVSVRNRNEKLSKLLKISTWLLGAAVFSTIAIAVVVIVARAFWS